MSPQHRPFSLSPLTSRPACCTAIFPRRRASRPSRTSRTANSAAWWPPTSLRAASTSRAYPFSLPLSQITLVINREPPATRSGVADVETYIHRSGRTGRAGRKGVCITLSTGFAQEAVLQSIEKAVGNPFTRIGAPQPSDLLKARAERLVERIGDLDEQLIAKMDSLAEEVLAKAADPRAAVARCLCLAVGAFGKMKTRSILTSNEGSDGARTRWQGS